MDRGAISSRGPDHWRPWHHPVAHRSDDDRWIDGPEIHPRQTLRICGLTSCENPGSYEITGVIGGHRYDVAVRAKNVNGWGEWHFIGMRNVADGFTSMLQSALINGPP